MFTQTEIETAAELAGIFANGGEIKSMAFHIRANMNTISNPGTLYIYMANVD